MQKNNKKCITCGKEYRYCPTCKGIDYSEAWKNIYCSRNCQEIFNIATGFANHKLTADEAKARLDKCDLSYKAKMKPNLIARMDEIIAEANKGTQEAPETPVVETTEETATEPEPAETSEPDATSNASIDTSSGDYKNFYKINRPGKTYKRRAEK